VSALDPATGRVYWDVPSEVDMGMTVATPVRSGPFLLVTSFYNGARMLRLDLTRPGATMLWSGKSNSEVDTDTIHSTISTPVIDGDYIYGIDSHGELRCLEAATGRRVWESQALIRERARWATAFLVKNGDRYFINNDRGELVIARLSPKGFEEISRTQLIEPTHPYARRRELGAVHWSHPAYANRHVFVRNDRELLKASLEKDGRSQGAGSRAAGR
jgi:outer membrane protein assembly factor BamB